MLWRRCESHVILSEAKSLPEYSEGMSPRERKPRIGVRFKCPNTIPGSQPKADLWNLTPPLPRVLPGEEPVCWSSMTSRQYVR
jgi:hypothetical protein